MCVILLILIVELPEGNGCKTHCRGMQHMYVLALTNKGWNSKNVSRTNVAFLLRYLNTYGEHKGCFQKALANLI